METKHTATSAEDLADAVSKALRRAFILGQTYWQRTDSESYSQNKKSDETAAKFAQLVDETRAAIAAAPLVPEGWKHTIMRAAECLEILNERPRPMCRDCADENGICPNGGLDCDMRKLIADVRAIAAALAKAGAK